MDAEKTKRMLCDEIEKITDKGLNTTNIEHLYKLIDMYKDLITVGAMEEEGYRNAMSYDGASNRDYAEARYSQAKADYRSNRAGKSDVMESLNGKMKELKKELEMMSRESDFPEEREKIDKYVDMIGRML